MITPTCFIGCDVGKKEIAVFHSDGGASYILPNQPEALARFVQTLDPGCLVLCEAAGGYEAALLDALYSAGHACRRADARKVKAFIRSLGTLAKTDAIDARMLARYGQERHDRLARWKPWPAEQQNLHALVMARRDIVAAITAWNNRAKAPGAADIQPLIDPIVHSFRTQLKAIDSTIATLVRHSQIAVRARTLLAIPGIGATTAYSLLALMPERGTLSRKQAASLAGLAPHPAKADQRMPIAASGAADPPSETPYSWPRSPPPVLTPPSSSPSTNASSKTAKSLSSPSPPSCESSSHSQMPHSN